jgi:hypothetical protein
MQREGRCMRVPPAEYRELPAARRPCRQVYAELSWDLERAALRLDKLQSFFLADVEAEHTALRAFGSGARLASFRLVALPQGLPQRLAALAGQVRAEAARAAAGVELPAPAGPGPGAVAGEGEPWVPGPCPPAAGGCVCRGCGSVRPLISQA